MNPPDVIETFGKSVVQHGKCNDRAYLMKLSTVDLPGIIGDLDALAMRKGYSKIFAKVRRAHVPVFTTAGYRQEALVPKYFRGLEDCAFLGKYFTANRRTDPKSATIEEILRLAREKAHTRPSLPPPGGLSIRLATKDDVQQMADIYREVFASYPFPIHDPNYVQQTMLSHVRYFLAIRKEKILALSSAEMDGAASAVEMTDFATLPEHRGSGLAALLLSKMETDPIVSELYTAYTIARAQSPGMNVTFARLGYRFAGTLIQNTDISGNIESMNVWYKPLSERF